MASLSFYQKMIKEVSVKNITPLPTNNKDKAMKFQLLNRNDTKFRQAVSGRDFRHEILKELRNVSQENIEYINSLNDSDLKSKADALKKKISDNIAFFDLEPINKTNREKREKLISELYTANYELKQKLSEMGLLPNPQEPTIQKPNSLLKQASSRFFGGPSIKPTAPEVKVVPTIPPRPKDGEVLPNVEILKGVTQSPVATTHAAVAKPPATQKKYTFQAKIATEDYMLNQLHGTLPITPTVHIASAPPPIKTSPTGEEEEHPLLDETEAERLIKVNKKQKQSDSGGHFKLRAFKLAAQDYARNRHNNSNSKNAEQPLKAEIISKNISKKLETLGKEAYEINSNIISREENKEYLRNVEERNDERGSAKFKDKGWFKDNSNLVGAYYKTNKKNKESKISGGTEEISFSAHKDNAYDKLAFEGITTTNSDDFKTMTAFKKDENGIEEKLWVGDFDDYSIKVNIPTENLGGSAEKGLSGFEALNQAASADVYASGMDPRFVKVDLLDENRVSAEADAIKENLSEILEGTLQILAMGEMPVIDQSIIKVINETLKEEGTLSPKDKEIANLLIKVDTDLRSDSSKDLNQKFDSAEKIFLDEMDKSKEIRKESPQMDEYLKIRKENRNKAPRRS